MEAEPHNTKWRREYSISIRGNTEFIMPKGVQAGNALLRLEPRYQYFLWVVDSALCRSEGKEDLGLYPVTAKYSGRFAFDRPVCPGRNTGIPFETFLDIRTELSDVRLDADEVKDVAWII